MHCNSTTAMYNLERSFQILHPSYCTYCDTINQSINQYSFNERHVKTQANIPQETTGLSSAYQNAQISMLNLRNFGGYAL